MEQPRSFAAKRLSSDWRDDDCVDLSHKRVRHVKEIAFPTQRDVHTMFRLYCISKPNEHDFNVLLEGALRCYCTGVLERAKTLVFVKFDHQLFSDVPNRAHELVDTALFDEFSLLYKDTGRLVPLHGVAFRGYDLHIQYPWLVSKVVDGRVDPIALVWEVVTAGLELPVDTQLRWAVNQHHHKVGVAAMSL